MDAQLHTALMALGLGAPCSARLLPWLCVQQAKRSWQSRQENALYASMPAEYTRRRRFVLQDQMQFLPEQECGALCEVLV